MAAYMQGACNNGDFTVPPLPNGTHYVGPTVLSANQCECSTVVYSLVSACADCQGQTYLDWSIWSTNCTEGVYVTYFPMEIPTGTAIPDWAYLDVTGSDRYNGATAEADVDKPESSAGGNPTVTNPGPASPTSTTQTTKHPTAAAAVKKSIAGPIAGGVVGGVVFLGVIAGLAVFFFQRRKQSHVAPSAAYNNGTKLPTSEYSPQSSTPFNNFSDFSGMQQRPYDPSDPTTFPTAAPTPTIHTTSSTPGVGYYEAPPRGAYSGVPEL